MIVLDTHIWVWWVDGSGQLPANYARPVGERQAGRSRSVVVPTPPGVNHLDAIRALQKAGLSVARQGKHTIMTDGSRILSVQRRNPVNAITMGHIVRDAGLTNDEFRRLL